MYYAFSPRFKEEITAIGGKGIHPLPENFLTRFTKILQDILVASGGLDPWTLLAGYNRDYSNSVYY